VAPLSSTPVVRHGITPPAASPAPPLQIQASLKAEIFINGAWEATTATIDVRRARFG